jgi:hypothetical protein
LTSPKRPLWPYAALACGGALILAAAPAQYLGRQQDDLLYIVASQSLAHGSYRLETAVGRPLMSTITPGWPALLLPLSLLCPERLGAYELFAALLQAAIPFAVFAWARRRLDDAAALLVALLCAASPLLLSQAGAVMSETPYLLATLGLFWALERGGPRAGARAGGWLAALLQLRPAGVSLLPAAAAGFLRAKKPRPLAWALGIPAAATAAWGAASWLRARAAVADAGKIAYEGRSWAAPLALGGLDKPLFYARALGGGLLPRAWSQGPFAAALGAALLLSAAWGTALALRKRWDDPPALALVGTAGMLAVWAWQYERYWIPALPLLFWACALAWGRAAKPALAALLVLELAFGAPPWLMGTSWRRPELARTYTWLTNQLRADDALASAVYVRDGFYAGRPGAPLPDTPTSAEFAAQLRAQRVRYALWQDRLDIGLARRDTAYLQGRLARAGEHLRDAAYFEPVYTDEDEGSRVYRLR